ncbi:MULTISPECIES: hypothetical protein [unclassified Bradyrhizobium]|uniref:hypothetical protein n=1 Tax=unclassified Bradyrhizobium TaxID=2631580 RepID=UPI0028E2DBAA|nr:MULTISPECIES: hypothetical protein [unclassified Bradyrhizobium]
MSIGSEFKAFAGALRADFLAAMSGSFSVPFAAVSVFADQKYQPLIWAFLAYSALIYAAFRLWRTQHLQVQALGMRLAREEVFRRNVDVGEAVAFLSLGVWGKRFSDVDAGGAEARSRASEALEAFLQGAADGDFPVWGKRGRSAIWEDIPAKFWLSHQIGWSSLLGMQPATERRKSSVDIDSLLVASKGYSFLMTSREAVERRAERDHSHR